MRIGTKAAQKRAFIAGISGKSIAGPAQPVLVDGSGQLGTASTASIGKSAKRTSTDQRLSKLRAEVQRQRRGFTRLQRAVSRLRAEAEKGD